MHLRAGHVDPVLQLLHHLLPDGYRFGLQARTAVLRLVRIPRDHCRRGSDASEQRAGGGSKRRQGRRGGKRERGKYPAS